MHQRKSSKLRNNAYTIMGGVLDALTGTSENQCQILHHLIDYVIFVISEKFKRQHGDEATVCLEKLDEHHDWPARAVELIDQWLLKVIEHVKFGGDQLKKIGDEVHVSLAHNLCQLSMCIQCVGMESAIHKQRFKLQVYSEVLGALDYSN